MSATAKSWHQANSPDRAHDNNYNTYYSVKDQDTVGNYLKLTLSDKVRVGRVEVVNRLDGCCAQRIVDTVVDVRYMQSVTGHCGIITGTAAKLLTMIAIL